MAKILVEGGKLNACAENYRQFAIEVELTYGANPLQVNIIDTNDHIERHSREIVRNIEKVVLPSASLFRGNPQRTGFYDFPGIHDRPKIKKYSWPNRGQEPRV